jgi:hypothetical protein
MTILPSGSSDPTHVTVRELGGEIWAELSSFSDSELPWQTKNRIVDVVMGVIARHVGSVVKNDSDLPVSPLPVARDGH